MGITAYATSTMTKLKIKITLVRSDQNMSLVLSHLSAMTPPMNNKKIWGKVDPIITNPTAAWRLRIVTMYQDCVNRNMEAPRLEKTLEANR